MKKDDENSKWWKEFRKYERENKKRWKKYLADCQQREEEDKRREEKLNRIEEKWGFTSEKLGNLSNNIGYQVEHYFQTSIKETLTFGGEKYDYMVSNLKPDDKKDSAEFDIVLFNGKSVAIIETKHRIHPNHLKEMVEKKVPQFRRYFTPYKKHKLYLGLAGFSFDDEVCDQARKLGVGIIKQAGKSIEIEADKLKAY